VRLERKVPESLPIRDAAALQLSDLPP